MIRQTRLDDLKALVALEQKCFDSRRVSARQFRNLLTRAHAATLVGELEEGIVGDVAVLIRCGTSLARRYSIAVNLRTGSRGTEATGEFCSSSRTGRRA